jgi:hypothetical protein
MLTDSSFSTTSEVWTSAILEWLKLRRRDHDQWHDRNDEFHENLPIDTKVTSGKHPDSMTII